MDQLVTEIKYKRVISEKDKIWREENRERLNKKSLLYNSENKERLKLYRQENKEKLIKTSVNWQKEHKERSKEFRKVWANTESGKEKISEVNLRWRTLHREEHLKRRREQYIINVKNDPIKKFSANLRKLVIESFKRGKLSFIKKKHSEEILGCSIEFFIEYILLKCPEGIMLKDFGRFGYQIDHIIPISLAITEEDVIRLNHYTNLQPLWWKDNLSKSNKII